MKIAQIAPLRKGAGGGGTSDPERALSYLTDELIRRRHEVTLFAGAGSDTSAKLEAIYYETDEAPFSRESANWNGADAMIMAAEQAFGERADEFDIIHSHFGIDGLPMARRCLIPTLTTLHGPDRLSGVYSGVQTISELAACFDLRCTAPAAVLGILAPDDLSGSAV